MAQGKASKGSAARGRGARRPVTARPAAKPKRPAPARPERAEPTPALPAGPFRLGAVPGATPGKWIGIWRERMAGVDLELVVMPAAAQRDALADGTVDAALLRLPVDDADLHVIPLYEEQPVVVVAVDNDLTVADELAMDDLVGELVIVPRDDVLDLVVPGTRAPEFAAPVDTEEAIATVAAGVGVVIVPMSLARLHTRKDVTYRVLSDGPLSRVALAWPRASTTALVDAFVGIVRGRTANSSR